MNSLKRAVSFGQSDSELGLNYMAKARPNFRDVKGSISSVDYVFDGTAYASSLFSINQFICKANESSGPFLKFSRGRFQRLSYQKRVLLDSFIPVVSL